MVKTVTLVYPQHALKPTDFATFIEADGFLEDWESFGLTDNDLESLQYCIMGEPTAAPEITATDGLREGRFLPEDAGAGVIAVRYVFFEEFSVVFLVIAFKGESELTITEKADIRELIAREHAALVERFDT